MQAWLRLRLAGSHTWRAYRKEAERFLLWAVMERRRALSSLDGDDCVAEWQIGHARIGLAGQFA